MRAHEILQPTQPRIGDIVEFETDPTTVVEGVIVGETEDGYIYEFSSSGYTELHESCTYGKYYCSTDKVYKCRKGPKQTRTVESWSKKYKDSINCSHPKGFSQKAHCAGKKKHNESVEMEMVCEDCGMCQTHGSLNEIKKGQKDANGYTRCWPGKHAEGTKKGKNGGQVRNCVPNESFTALEMAIMEGGHSLEEAEYHGRKVQLGKPTRGDVKKFKVYVRDPKTGNIKKVNFGDPNMKIKKNIPARRKSFRARHKCDTAKDRTTARYWSCRKW